MSDPADHDRPMLRPSVRYAAVEPGVYIELGERSFLMKGAKLREIIIRLLGALTGRVAIGTMRSDLPEAIRPMFDAMLKSLAANDMLVAGPKGVVPPDETSAPMAGFLQDTTDDWEEGLADIAAARISVWSDPQWSAAIVRSLIAAGVRRITVVDTGLDDRERDALRQMQAEAPVPCDVVIAQTAPAPPAGPSLLLFLGSEAQFRSAPALAAAAETHEAVLPAIVGPGCAVVGPKFHGALAGWSGIPADMLPAGSAFPAAAMGVTAALLAMETALSLANRHAARDDRLAQPAKLHVVHADGTVHRYDKQVLLASGRSLPPATSPHTTRIDQVAEERWADPDIGIFEPVAPDAPPYPLPHQAIRVHRASPVPRGGEDSVAQSWGLTARDAFDRAMRQACERIAEEGSAPGATAPQMAAARQDPDEAVAFARAMAWAARMPAGASRGARLIDAAMECDADGQMLFRLARLYWRRNVSLYVRAPAADANVAWAVIGDMVAVGIGRSVAEAATEALGEAISALQLDRLPHRQRRQPWHGLREDFVPPHTGAAAAEEAAPATEMEIVIRTDVAMPGGIHVAVAGT